jgi:hypothetical protein
MNQRNAVGGTEIWTVWPELFALCLPGARRGFLEWVKFEIVVSGCGLKVVVEGDLRYWLENRGQSTSECVTWISLWIDIGVRIRSYQIRYHLIILTSISLTLSPLPYMYMNSLTSARLSVIHIPIKVNSIQLNFLIQRSFNWLVPMVYKINRKLFQKSSPQFLLKIPSPRSLRFNLFK